MDGLDNKFFNKINIEEKISLICIDIANQDALDYKLLYANSKLIRTANLIKSGKAAEIVGWCSSTSDGYCFGECVSQCHNCSEICYSECATSDCVYCAYCDYCNSGLCYCQGECYCEYQCYCNYGECYCDTCQICNSCQGKCEFDQFVAGSKWGLGKFNYNSSELNADTYSASSTYTVGSKVNYNGVIYECIVAITTPETFNPSKWKVLTQFVTINSIDWNGLVNYINKAATIASVTFPATPTTISQYVRTDLTQFNTVNNAINTFLNSSTGITRSVETLELLSDAATLRNEANKAKIADNISCCETSGGQGCITRQR